MKLRLNVKPPKIHFRGLIVSAAFSNAAGGATRLLNINMPQLYTIDKLYHVIIGIIMKGKYGAAAFYLTLVTAFSSAF